MGSFLSVVPSRQPGRGVVPEAPSASVQCEILPVGCVQGKIATLQREPGGDPSPPGWWQELPAGQHPTRTVLEALSRELTGVFDPATAIVHSTSWRYEARHLVLSYLTVLQPEELATTAPLGFRWQSVRAQRDRASRTGEPGAIPVIEVVTHGLRHLAMLRISDAAVAEGLSRCWHEVLADWNPLPAGLLDLYVPEHHGTAERSAPAR